MPIYLQGYKPLRIFFFTYLALGFFAIASANTPSQPENTAATEALFAEQAQDPVAISLLSEDTTIMPGRPFWLAVQVTIDPSWHAYWINPGDAGIAPTLNWNLPDGFKIDTIQWPTPKRFSLSSIVGFGYENSFTLLVKVIPPNELNLKTAMIDGSVQWLVCSDSACLPGESQVKLSLNVESKNPEVVKENEALFIQARANLPRKNQSITAKRKDDLIEVTFQEKSFIKHADFYPENSAHIDYKTPPVFSTSPNNQKDYTLVLKEKSSSQQLKGILCLETAEGKKAFDLNLALENSPNDTAIALNTSPSHSINSDLFTRPKAKQEDKSFEFEGGLALAIALAFIGGLILNLMPCVLPVISFKVMSFIKLANQSRRLIFQHGLAFTGGVLVSFWVLAALLLSLQAYGNAVGWGFQLQEPLFVACLAALIFVFALSLFGLFEMGTSLIAAASQAESKTKEKGALLSSFFSGILATAVATPCTGPFLGSAIGFAVTLPPVQAMSIFTSLGLGMSMPYLLIAASPKLLKFLPKPGAWMITFKEVMGFLMMATVLWLLFVFASQTSSLGISALLFALFALSLSSWIFGKWGSIINKKRVRLVARSFAAIVFIFAAYVIVIASTSFVDEPSHSHTKIEGGNEIADAWEEFSLPRLHELRAKGTPVFIDFTSKWCLICQANHLVLSVDHVKEAFLKKGIVKMKADWTKRDAIIAAELRKFGRNSVPLYVYYDKEDSPAILPQVLSPEVVLSYIQKDVL